MMRFLLMMTGLMCGLFLCGCNEGGNSSKAPDAAAVSFTVEWIDDTLSGGVRETEERLTALLSDDCAGRGVSQVAVRVNDSAGATLSSGTFPCSAKTGTLSGITPGSGYTIIVSGLNASGTATYRGQKTRVTLNSGPNAAGVIQVTRINNTNPVAAITSPAGGATFQPGASVTFSGAGTDTENGQLTGTYLVWTSSRDGEIGTGKTFTTTSLSTGAHTITLTVTDRDGATGSKSINITIAGDTTNNPPVADAGPDQIVVFGSIVRLDGQGSFDSDDGIKSYQWVASSSGTIIPPVLSDPAAINPSFTAPSASGWVVYQLTVTDYRGLTDTDTVKITVNSSTPASITNDLDMTFNYIPPGTFMMGSPADEPGRDSDETRHQVTLTQGFYIQTTEVTQGQWRQVMDTDPSYFTACGDNCPVENISWDDAQAFVNELNRMEGIDRYRLPTEAQWEYAARAGSTTAFANGGMTSGNICSDCCEYDQNLTAMGWYCYNSNDTTHPVAQKTSNAWGLFDMHGNVWEWCEDRYGTYPPSSVTDPTGPLSGDYRVLRGGCWNGSAGRCRSANRNYTAPAYRDFNFGFRLVLLPGQ